MGRGFRRLQPRYLFNLNYWMPIDTNHSSHLVNVYSIVLSLSFHISEIMRQLGNSDCVNRRWAQYNFWPFLLDSNFQYSLLRISTWSHRELRSTMNPTSLPITSLRWPILKILIMYIQVKWQIVHEIVFFAERFRIHWITSNILIKHFVRFLHN